MWRLQVSAKRIEDMQCAIENIQFRNSAKRGENTQQGK
jgi:hypothetical protein